MILRSTTSRALVAATSILFTMAASACGQADAQAAPGEPRALGTGFPPVMTIGYDRPEPASPKGPFRASGMDGMMLASAGMPAGEAAAQWPPVEVAPEAARAEQPAEEEAKTGPSAMPEGAQCVQGKQLFSEDFESGDYDRWSSNTYLISANEDSCYESEFTDETAVSGTQSHRTSISCSAGQSHRIYGGVQFNGDDVVETYNNSGRGIDAPGGVVVSFWNYLDAENLGNGRWFSPFTVNNACNWSSPVITLAIEDGSGQLNTSHITGNGGTVNYVEGRPAFPLKQWVRVTVYINYHTGQFHVWQDGVPTTHATFSRNSQQICQFHWGLYASGPNDNITLLEDDISVWKLNESPTDFDHEPWPVAEGC